MQFRVRGVVRVGRLDQEVAEAGRGKVRVGGPRVSDGVPSLKKSRNQLGIFAISVMLFTAKKFPGTQDFSTIFFMTQNPFPQLRCLVGINDKKD